MPSPKPIRILLADDHEIVLEGLSAILAIQSDFRIVGAARDGAEAVHLARIHRPDVILMDLMMPGMDGLCAIPVILQSNSRARILVLTSYADDDRVFPAIQAGALGYLLKDTPRAQLVQAIHDVALGKAFLDSRIALKVMRELSQPSDSLEAQLLTHREKETLRLIALGLSNQQIACRLHISENTVAKYVGAILDKLHLANRTQAALYALRKGLMEEEGPP